MKLIDKDALVEKIQEWTTLLMNEINQKGVSQIDKLSLGGRIAELQEVKAFLDTFEVKDDSLEKFKSLQHISGDLHKTLEDWGYAPNLYYFDGSWHVDWISCEEGDSIKGFTEDTAEEAINKAYNWFHSTFCNS